MGKTQLKTPTQHQAVPFGGAVTERCWGPYGNPKPYYTVGGESDLTALRKTPARLLPKSHPHLPCEPASPPGVFIKEK